MFPRIGLTLLLFTTPLAAQETKVLNKTTAEWLKELKENKGPKVRRASVIALTVIGAKGPGVLPGLTEALQNDPEAEVRRDVANALGQMSPDSKSTVDVLAEALKSDKAEIVREASARALGKLADFASIHVVGLGRALKDPDEKTRQAAAEALQNFGDKAQLVAGQLMECATNAKEDRFTRQFALLVIAKQPKESEATFKGLHQIAASIDNPTGLRKLALESMAGWEAQAATAVPLLGKVMSQADAEPSLRLTAAATLGKFADKAGAAWPAIKETLKESDNNLRVQAIRLAGLVGAKEKEAAPLLLDMLAKEQNAEVVLAIIQELGDLGFKNAEAALVKLTENDVRQVVREAAADALKKIRGMS